jgi:hypothetical protein
MYIHAALIPILLSRRALCAGGSKPTSRKINKYMHITRSPSSRGGNWKAVKRDGRCACIYASNTKSYVIVKLAIYAAMLAAAAVAAQEEQGGSIAITPRFPLSTQHCISIYISMHAHRHAHMYTHTYIWTHTYIYPYIHPSVQA